MADDSRPPLPVEHVDVPALLAAPGAEAVQVLWSTSSSVQANLVRLAPGACVARHTEHELDVVLVVVGGSLRCDAGSSTDAGAPSVLVLPAGTPRALTAGPDGAAYLTVHRARPSLLPRRREG